MTASQSSQSEKDAAPGAVPLDCLYRIFRARRQKTARWREQRREQQLVATHCTAQHHARHPRTILGFHPVTPARIRQRFGAAAQIPADAAENRRRPPRNCTVVRAARFAPLRSGSTNISVRVNRHMPTAGGAGHGTRERWPALSARPRKEIGADPHSYNPARRGNRDRWGETRKRCPRKLGGTQGGACGIGYSTIKYARSRGEGHYSDARELSGVFPTSWLAGEEPCRKRSKREEPRSTWMLPRSGLQTAPREDGRR